MQYTAAGGMSYVLLQQSPKGSRRVSLGPVSTKTIEAVRRDCHLRRASPEPGHGPPPAALLFRNFVEGAWTEVHFERYKPSTKKGFGSLLTVGILPAFGSKPLDRITPAQVRRWFDEFSRTAPGNANNALKLFRQIMNFAIARGHIETNPSRGIRRNRRPALTRFLPRDEIARLHRVLDEHAGKGRRAQADIVRLLLLTGCRKSEIVRLRWSEVHEEFLVLAEAKTGPRKVPPNTRARTILHRQPRSGSPFVFPSPRDSSRPRGAVLGLWRRVRMEAGIEDVRLHDLRHTHASHEVMNGAPVPVASWLLGHADIGITLRYAHLGDREIEQAAERVGQAVADLTGLP